MRSSRTSVWAAPPLVAISMFLVFLLPSPASASSGILWQFTCPNTGPTAVSAPPSVAFSGIAAGNGHDLALDTTGQAWAWGSNSLGQLGNGHHGGSKASPVRVSMPAGVTFTELSAGADLSLALDSGGRVWAWGADAESIFVSDRPVPASLPQRIRLQAITVGTDDNATALSRQGVPWSWAGVDGTPTKVAMPTGLAFTKVANGDFHTVALTADGAAWAWGYNRYGQLGNRSEVGSSVPVPVYMPAGVTFTAISAGQVSSFAVGSNGVAYGWGDNARGEVGTGSDMHSYHRPVPVQMPAGISFSAISSKDFAVGALATNGSAWYWGNCSNVPAPTPMPTGVRFVSLASAAHVLYLS